MLKGWRFAWLPLVAGAGPAHAHSPVPGIEGFYLGLLHPFSTPSQALLIVGLGLLAGAFTVEEKRYHFAAFPIACVLGLTLGFDVAELDTALFAVAFPAFALAALAPGRLLPLAVALLAIGGFLTGVASIPDGGAARDRLFTMSGSLVGANVGFLYLVGISLILRERYSWALVGIAFRIAAAWLGAISLLMFALGYVEVVPA